MDPDVAYESMKGWARFVIANGLAHDEKEIQAADEFLALDEWLSKGGYLPQPWTDAHTNGEHRGRSGL